MALKKLLRRALDRASSPATYDCGFDDADEEVVQQRLQVPGAPGYHKVRMPTRLRREIRVCGPRRASACVRVQT